MRGSLFALVVGVVVSAWVAAPAHAQFAPLDRPGPELSEPADALAASLACSPGVDGATRAPVLLIHGTGADSEINWSWNHVPALDALGIPWCTVDMPLGGSGDLQGNAEYVAHAIREMYRRGGRRISIIGHSQGGMSPRWVFRFWPDTRAMVDDLIGYAPPNHGSTGATTTCPKRRSCTPSTHQYRPDSNFNAALNSFTETFAGISYTNVYSHTDFIATPNADDSGTSSLHVGEGRIANTAIQDLCPLQTSEHLGLAYDAVAWALARDALEHDGPADERRVPRSVCAELTMPGVNKATFAVDVADAMARYAAAPSAADVSEEPALRCYVLEAGCGRAATPPATRMRIVSKTVRRKRGRVLVRVRCTGPEGTTCTGRLRVLRRRKAVASRRLTVAAGRTRIVRFEIEPGARRIRVRLRD